MLATRTLWDGVQVRSDNRHVIIERVFPLAQNYDDAFRVLNVWLRDTEQKVINLAPVPCDTVSLGSQQKTLSVSVSIDRWRTLDTLSLHRLRVIWNRINVNSQFRILVTIHVTSTEAFPGVLVIPWPTRGSVVANKQTLIAMNT